MRLSAATVTMSFDRIKNHDRAGLDLGKCELGGEDESQYASIPHVRLGDSATSLYLWSKNDTVLIGYSLIASWDEANWFVIVAVREPRKSSGKRHQAGSRSSRFFRAFWRPA